MWYHNLKALSLFIGICFVLIIGSKLNAQNHNLIKANASVTMIADTGFTQIEKLVYEKFRSILQSKKMYSDENFQIEYLIDAKEISFGEEKKILLSITILNTIHEKIIELNKKEQSFYLAVVKKTENDQNTEKSIREFISEEYIKQFRMISHNYIDLIDYTKLDNYLNEILIKN